MAGLLFVVAVVAAVVGLLVLASRGGARMLKQRQEAVAHLGKTLGLPAPTADRLALEGTTTSGIAFRLDTTRVQGQRGYRELLTMSAKPRRKLPTLVVRDRLRDTNEALPGLAEVRIGDPAFDDAFKISAASADDARALLTPALRAEMLGNGSTPLQRAELLRVSDAEVSLSNVTITPGLFDPARLERIAKRVLELCG